MALKLPDSAVPMGDFPVAKAVDIDFDDGENLQEKLDNGTLGGGGTVTSNQLSLVTNSQYFKISITKNNPSWYGSLKFSYVYGTTPTEVDITITPALNYTISKGLNTISSITYTIDGANITIGIKCTAKIYGTQTVEMPSEFGTINSLTEEEFTGDTTATLKESDSRGVITSLNALGLTTDATVEDVVNTLKNGESFLAPVNTFANYETIFPNKVPSDQWNKIHIIKGASLPNSHIRCFSQSGTCEYLANVNNTNITGWNDVSGTYTDISDAIIEKLGTEILKYPVGKYRINSNATGNKFTDLPLSDTGSKCGLIEVNGTAVGKSPFTDTWVYRMYKFECLTGTLSYIRRLNSGATAGQIELDTGWYKEGQETYTSLTELGLTADATIDDVIGALKDGETFIGNTANFTNYLTMFPNECNNDQYATLKVERTNGNRCFIEWRQKEGKAYAIGGMDYQSKFNGWQITRFKRDGFADDSIVTIGDTVSADGSIQTLASLGLLTDIMSWKTGVYKISHVSGITNIPSDITSTNPAFRLEHHNIKKWMSGHAPCSHTWAQRHSVIYCDNGSIYHRYTESGATAGTYIKDTGWQKISCNKYYSINQLNSVKGKSIELVANTDNTLKIVEALGSGEEFVEWFGNSNNRFGLGTSVGDRINYLRIQKTSATNSIILAVTDYGKTFSRVYNNGTLENWCYDKTKATLVTNTATLKLDVTKKNSAWYGAVKLTHLYATSPVEIEISFGSATEDLHWAVINGQKYVKKITFTQDSSNTAHYTIGIEFNGTTYGNYQAEVIGGFADINSLTSETFTGTKTASYSAPWGKNNGVTLVSAPSDIGLTFPCTTVQLAQAMRNKFNVGVKCGAIGMFNCEGKTATITDAPSDYGLLHIETFGHDRILIRFDGIGSSSYVGSWIGQIKGNNGTFSSITWSRLDLEAQVNELFQSVSSGKTLVANAITGKGVSTATNATFATMATNISKIPQTITWQEETVSASPDSTSRVARFVFSNTVLGVKQIIAPGYNHTAEATETKMFTINGNTVEVKLESGTWKMTAMVRSS